MSAEFDQQTALTIDLQLLHFIRYRDYPRIRPPPHEVKLLDSIALYLVNNEPNDVVAVTLDSTPAGLQFVLAKNDILTREDANKVESFFCAVASLQQPQDLLNFPLEHYCMLVKTRLRKITEIDIGIVDRFLQKYTFSDFKMEFKNIERTAEKLGRKWETSDPAAIVRHSFVQMIASARSLWPANVVITHKAFTDFLVYPILLSRCRFHNHECRGDRASRDLMEKYKRRLGKLAGYSSGAIRIHAAKQRYWPDGAKIPHIWVEDPNIVDVVVPSSPTVAASNSFPTITTDKLREANPNIIRYWPSTIPTFVHAELRLILHFETLSPSQHISPYAPGWTTRYLGLSRQSCQCCGKWIECWNHAMSTRWITSGAQGMSFKTWRLPDYFDLADLHVKNFISEELKIDMWSTANHSEPDVWSEANDALLSAADDSEPDDC